MKDSLELLFKSEALSLYKRDAYTENLNIILASTPETRAICNDPTVVGLDYTEKLESACSAVLSTLASCKLTNTNEDKAVVLHILRGGLNFGLRNALGRAYGWNRHRSAFISAQRARKSSSPSEWVITESDYKKVYFPKSVHVYFGDVVATGTSLQYALEEIAKEALSQQSKIEELVFFTIGGPRSSEIISELLQTQLALRSIRKATVVYFEGIFSVPTAQSSLQIKIDGTDLLRKDSLLAPEFLDSQYESPSYPLERCTIYDAGSRAFELGEYIADVQEYWQSVRELVKREKIDFSAYLQERAPFLKRDAFGDVDLPRLCDSQLQKLQKCMGVVS